MSRIRTVKPEFFTHPEIVTVSIPARLLLISLLTQADDEGRLYDQPTKIRANAFGDGDRVRIGALLDELEGAQRIVRYAVGAKRCIQICHFDRHQSVSKFRPSSLPAPGTLPEDSDAAPVVLHAGMEGKGREPGMEGKGTNPSPQDKPGVFVYPDRFEAFWKVYPRHTDKGAAFKAFKLALRRASLADLIAGAERYRDDPNREEGTTKYAQGWLSGDRWLDEPLPSRNGSARPDRASQIHAEAEELRKAGL